MSNLQVTLPDGSVKAVPQGSAPIDVARAMAELPELQREIVQLHLLEGLQNGCQRQLSAVRVELPGVRSG